MDGSGPDRGPERSGQRADAQGEPRAADPGQGKHDEVGQETQLHDREDSAAHGAGVEPFIDGHHEVPVDKEVDGEQRRRHRQARHQRHGSCLDGRAQVGAGPAGMLAGAGEPGHGVDADQPAPRARLPAGADHHAEPERDERHERGGPEADADVGRAADEARGEAETGVHQPRAEQRLPELVSVGGAGEPPPGAPGEQERDEGQPQRNERERAGFRVRRGPGTGGVQQQGYSVDQQPGLAGQACQDVEPAVLESGRGPDHDDRRHHHEGGNDGGLGGLEGTLQPQGHGKATLSGLISAQFHRDPWCHGPGIRPVSDRHNARIRGNCRPGPSGAFSRPRS